MILPEISISRLCVNMRPMLAIPRLVNGASRDPILFRQRGTGEPALPDKTNGILVQFGVVLARTDKMRAMSQLVGVVFSRGGPSQIISAVVTPHAIAMRNLVLLAWRRAMEYVGYNTVQPELSVHPIRQKPDILISVVTSVGLSDPRQPIPRRPHVRTKSPDRADGIPIREGYRFPNFIARYCVSHGVSPHVCGQGRALLKQCSGPHSLAEWRVNRKQLQGEPS